MALGLADARQRLAYINQYRELALGTLFAIIFCLWVLGRELPLLAVVLFGVWFVLACAFVQVGARARGELRLYRIAGVYFFLELALITAIATNLRNAHWLALLFYIVTILHANMV
ncbi:MAG: hypothetical protein ACRD1F_02360, partial [Terriglobales bacterium]